MGGPPRRARRRRHPRGAGAEGPEVQGLRRRARRPAEVRLVSCRAAFLAGGGERTKKKKKYYIEIACVGLMLELLACVPSGRGRVRRGDGECVCAGARPLLTGRTS